MSGVLARELARVGFFEANIAAMRMKPRSHEIAVQTGHREEGVKKEEPTAQAEQNFAGKSSDLKGGLGEFAVVGGEPEEFEACGAALTATSSCDVAEHQQAFVELSYQFWHRPLAEGASPMSKPEARTDSWRNSFQRSSRTRT